MAPFIGQNEGEDHKKKRSSLQNELVFSPKVCDDQKKKEKRVFAYQSDGFRPEEKKIPKWCHPKMVTPGRPPPPPSDATVPHAVMIAYLKNKAGLSCYCFKK